MLKTGHGDLRMPTFFPDGTQGVVRGVDSVDLNEAKVEGIVISTFHLLVNGVLKRVESAGGIHKLMNWDKVIITDSGGFQVFSLLRDNPKMGWLSEEGVKFRWNSEIINLTPEKSVELQIDLGSDIVICLDECTDSAKDLKYQEEAVGRTVNWAKRSKNKFTEMTRDKNSKPLIFAVIQGGDNEKLREYCTRELIKIGFDGYCYGGWPINEKKELLGDILKFTAELMPKGLPKYALGVGKPEDIVECFKMGYTIFDCVIPTREARHKRLYIFNDEFSYGTVNVNKSFEGVSSPVSDRCDCYTCEHYTRSYLYHLFKVGDTLAYRLATIHNLRFYTKLMEGLKVSPDNLDIVTGKL